MFFPYGDTAVASYAPTRPESCVDLFEKDKTKKKRFFATLQIKSTAVFNCLHFYKLKKRRRHRKNFPEKCQGKQGLSFSAISFTQKGMSYSVID